MNEEPPKTASSRDRSVPVVAAIGVSAIVVIVFLSLAVLLFRPGTRSRDVDMACNKRLWELGAALRRNAAKNDWQYPPPERWCDALVELGVEPESFRCPGAKRGPCNYAMNPHADPCSAGDVLLLFESEPGWNLFGGPELLCTENHTHGGCSLLFVDGHTEFVEGTWWQAELKWADDEESSAAGD
ncbi:MAG: hypothetical protein JW993_01015 [Sedimentisphaerales bacterium]|nr:hypothetical protein [Sedimentisphaerales bacterium]